MSANTHKSALRKFQALLKKKIAKPIDNTRKTATSIKVNAGKAKVNAGGIVDKGVVFFSGIQYSLKGRIYNAYDRIRFFVAEHSSEKEVDIIEYKGQPKLRVRYRVERYVALKIKNIREKMPSDFGEARMEASASFRSFKRRLRRNRLSLKASFISGFEYTREYVLNIRKSTIAGLSGIAVGGFALTFILMTVVNSYAMGVTINGEKVGFVESKEEFAAMVEDVERELSSENQNAKIQINEELIQLDSMSASKKDVTMMDEGTLKNTIISAGGITATAAAISVDGKPVLYVGTESDAEDVLMAIRKKYDVAGQDVVANFRQDVSVTDAAINVGDLMPTESAVSYLLTGNESIKKYKVKEDDTDWDIAVANGLTEKDIQEANPGIDTKVIKKGDEINISKVAPFVQMEIIATVNITEKINYKTKKVKTDTLYTGESEVKDEGNRGEASVTKRAIYINGKEESFQLIEKKVIKEPKKRVVLVGTKEKPAENTYNDSYSGSPTYNSGGGSYDSGSGGTLSNPLRNMELSSGYGYRWGRMHSGIDLRNPAGTPIYASAGGRVTSSGYDGAYGNTVRISHGNGMTTVYAHCSSLYVRSGATVKRGQQIGTVGRTGRATGNHLHFEVRINGSARNPYNYL